MKGFLVGCRTLQQERQASQVPISFVNATILPVNGQIASALGLCTEEAAADAMARPMGSCALPGCKRAPSRRDRQCLVC